MSSARFRLLFGWRLLRGFKGEGCKHCSVIVRGVKLLGEVCGINPNRFHLVTVNVDRRDEWGVFYGLVDVARGREETIDVAIFGLMRTGTNPSICGSFLTPMQQAIRRILQMRLTV
jgi:hypothetical protein